MATLKDLRRRSRATQSMQQIFKAMEMVSAAKLRRAQARAHAAAPYSRKITEVLANLAGAAAELEHPLFVAREVKHSALIVITADRGFAGTYSTSILRAAEAHGRGKQGRLIRQHVSPVGNGPLI
jgi:F-type H+-transporting ATPase subunit gamma